MNKSELVESMAEAAEISKAAAARALDGAIAAITGALKKGDTVTLIGFGSFYVAERAERMGKNLHTGKAMKIPAAKVPKFRPGKSLKDTVKAIKATKAKTK